MPRKKQPPKLLGIRGLPFQLTLRKPYPWERPASKPVELNMPFSRTMAEAREFEALLSLLIDLRKAEVAQIRVAVGYSVGGY